MQSSNEESRVLPIRVGKRMTQARRDIIDCFLREAKPLTIAQISAQVTANEASVYRTVHALETEGYVAALHYPDGSHRYELVSEHHHHLICSGCGFTVHLPCAHEERVLSDIKAFKTVTHHEVTYYGTCTTCG